MVRVCSYAVQTRVVSVVCRANRVSCLVLCPAVDNACDLGVLSAVMLQVVRPSQMLSEHLQNRAQRVSVVLSSHSQHVTGKWITVLARYAALVLHELLVGFALPSRRPGATPRVVVSTQRVRRSECR